MMGRTKDRDNQTEIIDTATDKVKRSFSKDSIVKQLSKEMTFLAGCHGSRDWTGCCQETGSGKKNKQTYQ